MAMAILPQLALSEDTELYISDNVIQALQKKQVLIIFDNSGSMANHSTVKEPYDPDGTYDPIGPDHALDERFIYFTKGGVDFTSLPVPDDNTEHRRFLEEINSCETARKILSEVGFYSGYVREYSFKGASGTWQEIPDNEGANIEVLDCQDDVLNAEPTNITGLPQGYPVNLQGTKKSPIYHSLDINESNVDWASGKLVTLYTDKYLRWYHNTTAAGVTKTYLKQAQDSITNVIKANPSVEFGLQVFNYNRGDGVNDGNGGRTIFGIDKLDATNQPQLLSIINNEITASTYTPLCESLYEASRYFAGKSIEYADTDITIRKKDDTITYDGNSPAFDTSIVSGGNYISPMPNCNSTAFVIIITDGFPSNDDAANSKIEALTALDKDGNSVAFSGSKMHGSYLPALAEWMYGISPSEQEIEHLKLSNDDLGTKYNSLDLNPTKDKIQNVKTITIGFNLYDIEPGEDGYNEDEALAAKKAEELLDETARKGGGIFIKATGESALTEALVQSLTSLEASSQTLTSASVAANNFDRTQTLDYVYYAMFDPDVGTRWQGNVKKYKVVDNIQKGKNGQDALNAAGTHFSADAQSYWSTELDGNEVKKGGVAEMLRNMKVDDRTILYDASDDTLTEFNYSNLTSPKGLGSLADLAVELDVPEGEVVDYLNWARGMDVDNEDKDDPVDTTDMRADVFADPLHSKPLVINYGTSIRIVVGTNAGVLHMFEDKGDTVAEDWAFMPKEFLSIIKPLRVNDSTGKKVYGVDGKITSYFRDDNGDGKVDSSTDQVLLFFGLRRGGTSYYALDVTDPKSPKLLWKKDSSSPGFEELGQSWSQPKIAYSKINASGTTANPVLLIGGGYDINKDIESVGTADSSGRAVYMLDALSGDLLWSLAPSGGTTTFPGEDSIPSSIATLDSNSDGLADRLYFGDTGGNIWRVDMPDKDPKDAENPWTVTKLAELGGTTDATDRRFFNEPSIVRTFISETLEAEITDVDGNTTKIVTNQEIPYDAVLIGSGNRSHPLGSHSNNQDMLFMVKDSNILTQSFQGADIPATITVTDLYDYSDNPFSKDMTTNERNTLALAVSAKSGWYMDLSTEDEQSTSSPIVINGVAYFTTFVPPSLVLDPDSCDVPAGLGWLYAVDLALGTHKYNWTDDMNPIQVADGDERKIYISEQYLGSPTLIVLPDEEGKSKGNIITGRTIVPVGFELDTVRTYMYIKEEQ